MGPITDGSVSSSDREASTSPTVAVLQSNSNRTVAAGSSRVVSLSLIVSLPVLLIIVTVVVVLLMLLVWLNYRSKRKGESLQLGTGHYNSVPTEEYVTPVKKSSPYSTSSKPKVQLMDPPIPGVSTQFVEAAQLGVAEGGKEGPIEGVRYPFTTEPVQSSSSSGKKVSRKLSSRRPRQRGGMKVQSSDRSSDGSEDGYASPNRFTPSSGSWGARVTPPLTTPSPERRIIRALTAPAAVDEEREEVQLPELSMCLIYSEEAVLTVKVERASRLPCRDDGALVDSYVRLFFIPKLPEMPQRKTGKTEIKRKDSAPVFNEEVQYNAMSMEELINSVLHVEVLDYRSFGKHNVLGQADLPLVQVQFVAGEAPLTLTLSEPIRWENMGTILVSLTYSHDSKKLGIIILRAKDLNKGISRETDAQAKVSITLNGDKILGRMRTKKKAQSCSPIFNETLSCTVEPLQLKNTAVNIEVLNENRHATRREIGQVILCNQCTGEEYRHWSDVMASPGKPIAEWHDLR